MIPNEKIIGEVKREFLKPKENIYEQDAFNMGVQIGLSPYGDKTNTAGNRIMIMLCNFEKEVCFGFWIVDEATGERVQITLNR